MREDWCVHYRGALNVASCAKGVFFADLTDRASPGFLRRLPCCISNTPDMECDHRRFPTEDELRKAKEKMNRYASQVIKVVAEVAKSTDRCGVISCPVCGRNLYWARNTANGHAFGACETRHCFRWMS